MFKKLWLIFVFLILVNYVSADLSLNCGNNVLNVGEECDDGNNNPNDGCDSSCNYVVPINNQVHWIDQTDNSCSDSSDGMTVPWCGLAPVDSHIFIPGDSVVFREGDYDRFGIDRSDFGLIYGGADVKITYSGTLENPIVIMAYPGEQVILRNEILPTYNIPAWGYAVLATNADYVIIQGFTVYGTLLSSYSNYNIWRNNVLYGIDGDEPSFTGDGNYAGLMVVLNEHTIVRNNEFNNFDPEYDTGYGNACGVQMWGYNLIPDAINNIVENNEFNNCFIGLFDKDNSRNNVHRKNKFYSSSYAMKIASQVNEGYENYNLQVYQNLVENSSSGILWGIGYDHILYNNIFVNTMSVNPGAGSSDTDIEYDFYNSIVLNTDVPILRFNGLTMPNYMDYDLYSDFTFIQHNYDPNYATTLDAWQEDGFDLNSQVADPMFIDSEYHLAENSLARGAGRYGGDLGLYPDGDEIVVIGLAQADENMNNISESQVLTVENLKVAFMADQGSGSSAAEVLDLIADEGTDMLLIGGDFDCELPYNPDRWDEMLTESLGENFPVFATVGNHDTGAWFTEGGYQDKLEERLARVLISDPGSASCYGSLGDKSICNYKGLAFASSSVGYGNQGFMWNGEHNIFIQDFLVNESNVLWKICSWHNPMEKMQVGYKHDGSTWEGYELCRTAGALIVNGHEHSYHRTHILSDMENQIVEDNISPYILKNGQTMSIVSGSGGRGVRNQVRCGPTTYPYGCNQEWGSIYTANQSGKHGVLFCTFNVDGQPDKASCYFKDVDNATIDTFELINENYGEVVAPFCGDGFCNEDENCSSCFEDCGVCPPDAADQTINLISGWNVISLNTSAFVFSGDLDLDLIMGYGDNSWETDWKIFSGDEFVLKPLQGYYVYADKGKSLTFSGYELSSDYSLVNNTWNLFSVRSSDSFDNIYGFSLDSGELVSVSVEEGSFVYSDVSGNLNPGSLYWAKIGDAQFGPVVQSRGILEIIFDFIKNLASINGYFFKAIS